MDNEYNAHTVTCANPGCFNGRYIGKGGVAILWHRSLENAVEIIETGSGN